jgi:hypothetical protein
MLTTFDSTVLQDPAPVFPSLEATAKAELTESEPSRGRRSSDLENFKLRLGPGPNGPVYVADTAGANQRG